MVQGIGHMTNNIISLSGGKDSTFMAHLLIDQGVKIHSAVWYVTPWEFPEMEDHIYLFQAKTGIHVVRLFERRPWDELLIKYKWPSIGREWCTREKITAINRYIGSVGANTVEYIGFSADEVKRSKGSEIGKKKHQVKYPLIENGITEKQALQECYKLGYDWGGLYQIYNRVSCFCCPKKGKKGLQKLRIHRPNLYKRILEMDDTIKKNGGFGMSRKTAHDWERTFAEEDRQMTMFEGVK